MTETSLSDCEKEYKKFEQKAKEALNSFKQLTMNIEEQAYCREYNILIDWFKSQEGHWDKGKVRLAGLAIYGWMPTILRAEGRIGKKGAKDIVYDINFKEIVDSLKGTDFPSKYNKFLNNRYIGTSKFLHFWKPESYAIWDSKVCKYLHGHTRANSKKLFDEYQQNIKKFCQEESLKLRCVEFALFQAGKNTID